MGYKGFKYIIRQFRNLSITNELKRVKKRVVCVYTQCIDDVT